MPIRSATATTRADQGQVRRDPAAGRRRRRRPLGGDARRLEPRGLEILARTRTRRSSWSMFLASTGDAEGARDRRRRNLPTIQALYDDADIAAAQPIIPRWKDVFLNAVPRPSAPAKVKYNEVSSQFWTPCTRRCPATARPPRTSRLLEARPDRAQGRRLVARMPRRRAAGRRRCAGRCVRRRPPDELTWRRQAS